MKKLLVLVIFSLLTVNTFAQTIDAEPDYSQIKFKKKVKSYKKSTPKIQGLNVNKAFISEIVELLGEDFYTAEKRDEIVERIWLSFTDPKKFDMVFKDYAIRTMPNWNKKNFRGEIVLEPNPYLSDWSTADTELDYFKTAMHRILMYEGLMGYGEDAKKTRLSLKRVKYISKYKLPQPSSRDYTNSYLNKLSSAVNPKGLSVLITEGSNFEFLVCQADKKDKLISLFNKMRWSFVAP